MIRSATIRDRPQFLYLWGKFLSDQRKNGSHLLDTPRNLHQFQGYFESYTFGALHGMVLFWHPEGEPEPVAVVMAGEEAHPSVWETDLGRMAILWGVWVDPEFRGQGITAKLFARAKVLGEEIGFETVETQVRLGNDHGERVALAFGTRAHSEVHFVTLEKAHG